jgi:DedD protein
LEEGLKKRLVGAAVLASLAVIFVPMLIEEPVDKVELEATPPAPPARPFESRLLRDEAPIPRRPAPVVRPEPASPPPVQARPKPKPKTSTAAAKPPKAASRPAPRPGARTGLDAWVVQVGSFSSLDNARKLVARLRKARLQVRDPERIELRGKVLYRVLVGPVLDKKRAQAMLPKVNRITGTQGSVRSYP